MNYTGPGRYRHYKGSEYDAIGLAKHESEREHLMVIYRPVEDENLPAGVLFWARPQDNFDETVEHKGDTVPRFEKIS